MTTSDPLFDETAPLLAALDRCSPGDPTACEDWAVHDLVAHLAAGADEIARTLEAHTGAGEMPPVRTMHEREEPYRRMPERALRERLSAAQQRLADALRPALAVAPDAAVPWMGRSVPVHAFVLHVRSELALHRWDLGLGAGGIDDAHLSAPELTAYAVRALADPLLRRGVSRDARTPFQARLRTAGQPDVVVTVAGGRGSLALASPQGPAVETDAATRYLLLWGRRPPGARRWRRDGLDAGAEQRLLALLAGY